MQLRKLHDLNCAWSRRYAFEERFEQRLAMRGMCFLQGDQSIANQAGAAFRSDLNSELQALVSGSSGATAPATTYAYQIWNDTTTGLRKQRNAANSGWIIRGELAETRTFDRSSNTILGLADFGCFFRATAGFTQTLTAAATLADGWRCFYRVESGATVVFDPNASENIDGATTKSVVGPSSGMIYCNGTAFFTIGFTSSSALAASQLVGAVTPFVGMINGTIVTSRAGNAETIAIKTLAGADPSSSDPVIFIFSNATAATGDYVFLSATAALSITISSGSTLGATNGVLFRLWLTVFNDAGTLRLGVVNCLIATSSNVSIMALKDDDLRSSTTEGASGTADSAQVIYSGTGVTTKAMRVLGYLEYTLAAVGTWGTAQSKIRLFGPGVPLPNQVVQTITSPKDSVFSTASTTPVDVTGLAATITPTSAANIVRVTAYGSMGSSSNGFNNFGLVRGATQIGVGAAVGSRQRASQVALNVAGNSNFPINTVTYDAPSSTSSLAYKAQIWTDTGTILIGSTSTDGNTAAYSRTGSGINAEEIMA